MGPYMILVRIKIFFRIMNAKRGLEFLRQHFAAMSKSTNFHRMGSKIKVISGGDGRCVGELKIEKEYENEGGTLHGGMTATLVDIMTTAALLTTESGRPGASIDLNLSYLSAVKGGETIIIDANVIREGKTLAFTTADIKKKDDGKIIALARHTKAFSAQSSSSKK